MFGNLGWGIPREVPPKAFWEAPGRCSNLHVFETNTQHPPLGISPEAPSSPQIPPITPPHPTDTRQNTPKTFQNHSEPLRNPQYRPRTLPDSTDTRQTPDGHLTARFWCLSGVGRISVGCLSGVCRVSVECLSGLGGFRAGSGGSWKCSRVDLA